MMKFEGLGRAVQLQIQGGLKGKCLNHIYQLFSPFSSILAQKNS